MTDRRLTKEQRKRAVLAEAAERLSSFAFSWQRGLTLADLANATGIDQGDISRDFDGKDGLLEELTSYCLDPDNFAAFGEEWAGELLERLAGQWLEPEVDLEEAFTSTFDADLDYVRNDHRLRAQMAIWALSLDDPTARAALARMYRFYDDQHLELLGAFRKEVEASGLHPVEGVTDDEMVVVLTALVEGMAIRSLANPGDVPDGLMGRIGALLMARSTPTRTMDGRSSNTSLRSTNVDAGLPRGPDAQRAGTRYPLATRSLAHSKGPISPIGPG
ncbi:MAG: hypothetical protein AAF567_13585 [Actinomycetota bacterium]